MNTNTIISYILIFMSIIIMIISLTRMLKLKQFMPFIMKSHEKSIKRYFMIRLGLLVLLFISCSTVLIISYSRKHQIDEATISTILFFGTLYVLSVTILLSRTMSEMEKIIHVIFPICFNCKKIRTPEGNHSDPKAWKAIDRYLAERVEIKFTHGLCPECLEEEEKKINY